MCCDAASSSLAGRGGEGRSGGSSWCWGVVAAAERWGLLVWGLAASVGSSAPSGPGLVQEDLGCVPGRWAFVRPRSSSGELCSGELVDIAALQRLKARSSCCSVVRLWMWRIFPRRWHRREVVVLHGREVEEGSQGSKCDFVALGGPCCKSVAAVATPVSFVYFVACTRICMVSLTT